jgi:hypothetical protein
MVVLPSMSSNPARVAQRLFIGDTHFVTRVNTKANLRTSHPFINEGEFGKCLCFLFNFFRTSLRACLESPGHRPIGQRLASTWAYCRWQIGLLRARPNPETSKARPKPPQRRWRKRGLAEPPIHSTPREEDHPGDPTVRAARPDEREGDKIKGVGCPVR